mgnify:CR=1 FL=1|tara:strand:- start:294 stop:1079 length:786 start_codon:yes stop_codon:yes gene_type:complete
MILSNIKLLKFFYKALITGLPLSTYNPLNNAVFHAPVEIKPYSTYVNYKLNFNEYKYLNTYLAENTNQLKLSKTKIHRNNNYFLSINMYNCTSPMFDLVQKNDITRCEINTYIVNKNNEFGTLITDYSSNFLSMDPDTIFKKPQTADYFKQNLNTYEFTASNDNFLFLLNYNISPFDRKLILDKKLIQYTDKCFYNNGIYDKIYYDSSLIDCEIKQPNINNVYFRFKDLIFKEPYSVFYFNHPLSFVGGIWSNLNQFNESL